MSEDSIIFICGMLVLWIIILIGVVINHFTTHTQKGAIYF